jgi:hypothetical protein
MCTIFRSKSKAKETNFCKRIVGNSFRFFHIKNKLQETIELDYDETTFVLCVVYSHYLLTFMYQFLNKLEIKSLLMTINLCRVYILSMTYLRIGHCISSL